MLHGQTHTEYMVNLDAISFHLISENEAGDVNKETRFTYQQQDRYIWGRYSGPSIKAGVLFGTMDEYGNLDFTYSHVDESNHMKQGQCKSTLEKQASGILRYHEKWRWTGDHIGTGTNIIEQIPQNG